MAWRELIIDTPCKISCSGNYLIVRNDTVKKIHISEITFVMVANTCVNFTGVALCELAKNKVKVVFCDEKRNPYGEMVSYYGCHNSSKKLRNQLAWCADTASTINTFIIHQKIINQANLLSKYGFEDRAKMLYEFADEIEVDDISNREGHSAKVYFNTLFGNDFVRDISSNINSALNYGYSILLSCINREIVANGCLTQLGINHKNEFNHFNLSCDIIEPFRVVVDDYVYQHKDISFDKDYKYKLVDLLNREVILEQKMPLINAISVSVKSVLNALDSDQTDAVKLFCFE